MGNDNTTSTYTAVIWGQIYFCYTGKKKDTAVKNTQSVENVTTSNFAFCGFCSSPLHPFVFIINNYFITLFKILQYKFNSMECTNKGRL